MAEDDGAIASASAGWSELDDVVGTVSVRTRELETGANGFARAISRAFAGAATSGRQFDDVLKGLGLRLSDLAVRAAFKPLERSLSAGIESLFSGLLGKGTGEAGASSGLAEAIAGAKPFADGGIIAAPSYFPLRPGQLGLAGEAGPEAILPLARGADGRLGVAAQGGGGGQVAVTVHIATPDLQSFRRSETYLTGQIARAVARGQRSL